MELTLSLLFGLLLGWAIAREYTLRAIAQQFLTLKQKAQAAEEKARTREWSLIDTYLRRQGAPALEIQRENILKLPDPEAAQARDYVQDAMRLDEIKEIAEERNPDAAWLSAEEIEQRHPELWKSATEQWEAEHTPLRVA